MTVRSTFSTLFILATLVGCGVDVARAAEAYLCDGGRLVYVKLGDLERMKRTDPCIAAYYGLTLPEAPPPGGESGAPTQAEGQPPLAPESPGEATANPLPRPEAARPDADLKGTTISEGTSESAVVVAAETGAAGQSAPGLRRSVRNPALGPIVWGTRPVQPAASAPVAAAPAGTLRIINAAPDGGDSPAR